MLRSLLLFALTLPAFAQFSYWPGTQYDPAIPTTEKVLGYSIGERVASHADLMRYFEALAAAAPSRFKLVEYARSWERKQLIYGVLASEANHRRMAEIQSAQLRLADPRKTQEADARRLIQNQPAIIGLSYGVHGNEISSPDAAMMTAYHLLAAKNDKLVQSILANAVVLIDPTENPDGRDRFVHNYNINEGLEPDPSPSSAERSEPWPGGRSNHYLFDLNRDWFALTQPETRGRVKYLQQWLPLVFVDLHEMGTDTTYFFAPGARPFNPNLTAAQKDQAEWFGRNNAKWFDQMGFSYFTREVYDEFYPGYGASWPWYYGGIGMTYENASVRGLIARRSDDSLYTFRESVKKHFVASISTLETAVEKRSALLENFYKYQVSAISEGAASPVKAYIFPRVGDASAVDKLALNLAHSGIEVQRATAPFRNSDRELPAGSYLVSLSQPRKRMINALLDPAVPLEPDFLKEQERRRKRKLPDEIYDVTAWSLPQLYNIESIAASTVPQGTFEPLKPGPLPAGSVTGKAEVAYLIPWGSQAAGRFIAAALRADIKLTSAGKSFKQGNRSYPAGTLIIPVKSNPDTVHDRIAAIARESGAEVIAVKSSWVEEGINFGSSYVTPLRKPVIAMAWDAPVFSQSAGHARYVIERQYGYPVTVVRTQSLPAADLSRFHVLILPQGSYASSLGGPAAERIRNWVRNGGVLIGIGSALNYLSSTGMLAVQQEGLARESGPTPRGGAAASTPPTGGQGQQQSPQQPAPGKLLTSQEDFDKAILADRELPDAVAGVLVRAKVDPEHWVTAGLPSQVHVLVNGNSIYSPLKQDRGVNAIVYSGPNELLASGYLWEENRKQLAFKPFVAVQREGRGHVVGFTADPNFRAYMDGLNVVFLNALFRAPASGRAVGSESEEQEEQH